MTGRSHNVAAQATTLGKRFASAADELLVAYERLEDLRARYPLRGIKGPMGTAQDMLDLLGGDAGRSSPTSRTPGRRAPRLRRRARQRRPGLPPLAGLRRGHRARAARRGAVVAGHDDPADGGPRAGHRGLPARPGRQLGDAAQDELPLHRADQRPDRAAARLRGHGRASWPGAQWNEGDVSDSVVRRVALPDAFFALDGLLRDVADRAGRARRLPRRDRPRARPLPAVPRDDGGAHGRGAGRGRPGDRARGDQGARRGRRARDAGEGPGRERPARAARRRRAAGPAPGARRPARRPAGLHRRGRGAGRGGRRAGWTRSSPRIPTPPPTPRERSCEAAALGQGPRRLRRRRTTSSSSPPTASRSTTSCCPRRSPTRARC